MFMVFSFLDLVVMVAAGLALMSLGGGFYEFMVVDPFWPKRPDLIQPDRGGISRKRFWIPAHTTFELFLIAALVMAWRQPPLRLWLLVALASHATMRIWSAFDFIPKALAFEKTASVDEAAAKSWSRRSKLRFPLDLLTCASLMLALRAVWHG
jgi:hypothetical protein